MKLTERLRSGMLVRHFKGNTYRILHQSEHTETGEILINYFASPSRSVTIHQWARPKHQFDDLVEHNGGLVPRFEIFDE